MSVMMRSMQVTGVSEVALGRKQIRLRAGLLFGERFGADQARAAVDGGGAPSATVGDGACSLHIDMEHAPEPTRDTRAERPLSWPPGRGNGGGCAPRRASWGLFVRTDTIAPLLAVVHAELAVPEVSVDPIARTVARDPVSAATQAMSVRQRRTSRVTAFDGQ
ncbi:hypothetical protein [Nocardia beijingensis]|uniref:hypothetical protein n=1 Tax=Nocardia beijingensis TaxID=95162 RepID=UPI0033C58EF4